jgi:tetratricopeptide (TPR) repeat protein
MKKLAIILFILSVVTGCSLKKKNDLAFKIFNDGVTLSFGALNEYQKGNYEKSEELNRKAIDKFIETLKVDSTNKLAPRALGHSYYLTKDYRNGIVWFEKAISIDSLTAINYIEYGLCKINLGDINNGRLVLEKAFNLDTSKEIRYLTIKDLFNISSLAFEYGTGYEKQGEKEKVLGYKQFSEGVLLTAYNLDSTNNDVIKKVAYVAEKLGDQQISKSFNDKIKK